MANRMTVAQVSRELEIIMGDVSDIKTLVLEHDKLLVRGNGDISLKEAVRDLQKTVDAINKRMDDQTKMWQGYIKMFVGLLAAQLISGAIALIVYVVRGMPPL